MTKQVSDYPVAFGYGAVDDIYYYTPSSAKPKTAKWIADYHRGEDRYTPYRTPLYINSVLCGYTGNSGKVSGPHIHIGRFVNGIDTHPHGGGMSFENATVIDVGFDPTNGKYFKIRDIYNIVWVYLHMDEILVNIGQQLTRQGGKGAGEEMLGLNDTKAKEDWVRNQFQAWWGLSPTTEEMQPYIGQDYRWVSDDLGKRSMEARRDVASVKDALTLRINELETQLKTAKQAADPEVIAAVYALRNALIK